MQHISEITTPSLIIDKKKLQDNIQLFQKKANKHKLNIRPHIKTHKCLEIAQMQLNAGAVGITAAKIDEALVFIESGITSVTIAYPLVISTQLDILLQAARSHNVELRLIIDSLAGVRIIAQSAAKYKYDIGIFIKIDVGLHRCGIQEDDPILLELAQQIIESPYLDFLGLLSHAGQAYSKKNRAEVSAVARQEWHILTAVKKRLENQNILVKEISIGSTPTVLASDIYEGISEIRPGNYVFMDQTPLRLKLIEPKQISLSILATVVSQNSEYYIIDAGSKVLSSDFGGHGANGKSYGLAYPVEHFIHKDWQMEIAALSEEHGFVTRGNVKLNILDKVRIIPNHACAVANLSNSYTVIENDKVIANWPVAARGRVR